MMEFINDFSKLQSYPKDSLLMAIQCLFPFAPHLAEEGWQFLKGEGELSYASYPKIDKAFLEDSEVTYVIQVNGKVRGRTPSPKT